MSASAFTEFSFKRALKAGDSRRYDVKLKVDKDAAIEDAIFTSSDPNFLTQYDEVYRKGKRYVIYRDYSSVLVLRALANNISYLLKLVNPDRDHLVKGIQQSLVDATPMIVHRRDIAAFYESIPIKPLQQALLDAPILTPNSRAILAKFFEIHSTDGTGLPRGTPLSAVLAEVSIQHFDLRMQKHCDIYRYFRYSDDILVFSHNLHLDFDKLVDEALHPAFALNDKKESETQLGYQKLPPTKSFEYLGYNFDIESGQIPKYVKRDFSTTISQTKLNKIKSRIYLSFNSFSKDGNFPLLIDRIKFLSGNYRIMRNRINHKAPRKMVRAGISFSYRRCHDAHENRALVTNKHCLSVCAEIKLSGISWLS